MLFPEGCVMVQGDLYVRLPLGVVEALLARSYMGMQTSHAS